MRLPTGGQQDFRLDIRTLKLIGLLGKVLGPLGFVWALCTGGTFSR